MGYVPPGPPVAPSESVVFSADDFEALRRMWATPQMHVALPPPDYTLMSGWKPDDPRGWTERHVNALGYGLIGAVMALVGVLVWIAS